MEFCLEDHIEVDELSIGIVNHFTSHRTLGKESCKASTECLGVDLMRWEERKDDRQQGLLTTIICDGCLQ